MLNSKQRKQDKHDGSKWVAWYTGLRRSQEEEDLLDHWRVDSIHQRQILLQIPLYLNHLVFIHTPFQQNNMSSYLLAIYIAFSSAYIYICNILMLFSLIAASIYHFFLSEPAIFNCASWFNKLYHFILFYFDFCDFLSVMPLIGLKNAPNRLRIE